MLGRGMDTLGCSNGMQDCRIGGENLAARKWGWEPWCEEIF